MIDLGLLGERRLNFIAATESNECGLACLACVSDFFQGECGLGEIRQLAVHSGRGETLLDLRNIAEQIGLSTRAVRVGLRGLEALPKPAVLHWQMNHFVVLERIVPGGVIIMDPAAGRVRVPWSDVDRSFTGVALELTTSERWRIRSRAPQRVSLLSLVGPLRRWRNEVAVILLLSVLLEALVLVAPLQMQMSVDVAVQAADGRLVWVLGAGFGCIMLIQACIAVMRAWSAAVFGTQINFDLHDRFVNALHRKPPRFFLRHHTADLLNRGRSVDAIQTLLTGQGIQVMLDTLISSLMILVMFNAVPLLATIVVAFGLLNIGVTTALRQAAVENSRRHLRAAAEAESLFLENARAARAIMLYGKAVARTNLWRNKFVEVTNLTLSSGRLQMYSAQAAQLSNGLGTVVLVSAGTFLVLQGSITLGTMMMFFVLKAFFVERLSNCVNFLMQLRVAQTHAERIEDVLTGEAAPQQTTPQAPVEHSGAGASIELRDVWFRYGNDSPWILQGVSCKIEASESVAITGPSGSGKTTLMNIMLGLLQPNRGEVLINGCPLHTLATSEYARMIGVVMQDDTLFRGTVADNIGFFDAPLNMQRVLAAAQKANVAREIQAMPMQYYSLLAEGGADVSGGQRQRLFIARALYHEPKILFLDEATSHLDSHSEGLVSQAVKAMSLTRVLIAHRKETIATAERVLVLTPTGTLAAPEASPVLPALAEPRSVRSALN